MSNKQQYMTFLTKKIALNVKELEATREQITRLQAKADRLEREIALDRRQLESAAASK